MQSNDSLIDLSDSNASLKLQSKMTGIIGSLNFRDLTSSSITASNTSCLLVFPQGSIGLKPTSTSSIVYYAYSGTIDPSTSAFGDGTRIQLGPDVTINSTDTSWAFSGNAEIDGNGATLTINKSQGITITGASKTLTLKNMTLYLNQAYALTALLDTSSIKLENVICTIGTPIFFFDTGSLITQGLVFFLGNGIGGQNFEFSSKGTFTVSKNSECVFGNSINFKMKANPSSDANFNATKRHLVLSSQNSILTLDGSSIESTNTGIAIDNGVIRIKDASTITTTLNSYAAFELAKGVNLDIATGANLSLNGIIKYNEDLFLKYGDGVTFSHNNYGFYFGTWDNSIEGQYYEQPLAGVSTITNQAKFYISPVEESSRFGSVGQVVRSGDHVKLESYYYSSAYYGYAVFRWVTAARRNLGNFTAAQVSSPNTTYVSPYSFGSSNSGGYDVAEGNCEILRIYKYGGQIGDSILKNDLIYFYAYNANANGGPRNMYLGSSNLTTGSYKEIYTYLNAASTAPPGIATNFVWKVFDIYPQAYLTAVQPGTNSLITPTIPTYSTIYAMISSWPAVSLTQF